MAWASKRVIASQSKFFHFEEDFFLSWRNERSGKTVAEPNTQFPIEKHTRKTSEKHQFLTIDNPLAM